MLQVRGHRPEEGVTVVLIRPIKFLGTNIGWVDRRRAAS